MKHYECQRLAHLLEYCRAMAELNEDDAQSTLDKSTRGLFWGKSAAYRDVIKSLAPLVETGAPAPQGKVKP